MTTWVLLRGLMREVRHWGEFPIMFQKAMDVQHVVALDLPGNGGLHALESPTSVISMAGHCRIQLKQLGYEPPYRVLAMSLGAMVAVAWSELNPAELEKMVLINTSLAPYNPFYQRLRPENYSALSHLFLYRYPAQRETLIMRLTSNQGCTETQRSILGQWISYAQECPVTRANILRQLKAALCYRASRNEPSAPVLLLAAQNDKLVDVKCSITLAQHWQCAIKTHPTAGHDLPFDDGHWVTQQIKEWLNT